MECFKELGVPLIGVNVKKHGSRGVTDIGGVDCATGELP